MGFLIFVLLIVLLVNAAHIIKFVGALIVLLMIVGFSYVSLQFGSKHLNEMRTKVAPVIQPISNFMSDSSTELVNLIKVLRVKLKSDKVTASEKQLLMEHLRTFEELKRQRGEEKTALSNFKKDQAKIKELKKLRANIAKRRLAMEQETRRLSELELDLERSERLLKKLNLNQ